MLGMDISIRIAKSNLQPRVTFWSYGVRNMIFLVQQWCPTQLSNVPAASRLYANQEMLMGKRLHCFLARFFLKSKVLTLCRARLSTVSPYTRTLLCLFCASTVLFHDLLSLSGAAGVSPEHWLGSAMGWRAENAPVAVDQLIGRGIAFGEMFIP